MNKNPTNAQEQYELGEKYEKGDGVTKDLQEALKWYTKAADQGHADALYKLWEAYKGFPWRWEGVLKDPVLKNPFNSYKLLSEAAERGSVEAQYHLGMCYRVGETTICPSDSEKATFWFTKAAEQGYSTAQIIIGECCERGTSLPKDLEKANYWYAKAAEQGNSEGQLRLGVNYYYGNGIIKDLEKAKHWISMAAGKGNESAQKALANLNEGKPPKKNPKCYIATCVYGSYDCPEVWTLRRFRDKKLSSSWFGRGFIQIYYTISPKLVELFGSRKWFSSLWKPLLNKMVYRLQKNGIEGSPYSDK